MNRWVSPLLSILVSVRGRLRPLDRTGSESVQRKGGGRTWNDRRSRTKNGRDDRRFTPGPRPRPSRGGRGWERETLKGDVQSHPPHSPSCVRNRWWPQNRNHCQDIPVSVTLRYRINLEIYVKVFSSCVQHRPGSSVLIHWRVLTKEIPLYSVTNVTTTISSYVRFKTCKVQSFFESCASRTLSSLTEISVFNRIRVYSYREMNPEPSHDLLESGRKESGEDIDILMKSRD